MVATRSILNCHEPATNCPFCLQNNLIPKEKIVAQTRWGYLVREYSQAVPGTLQIVPTWHSLNARRWLLFLWSLFWLLRSTPREDFNISINFGQGAGQTLPHPHVWVIPRVDEFAGKGLAHFVSLEAKSRQQLDKTLAELVDDALEHVS